MSKLKEFYAEASKNEELKAALVKAGKELEGATDPKAGQAKLIEIAKEFGYELTEADFVETENALEADDLSAVAGGTEKSAIAKDVGIDRMFCIHTGTWIGD